MNDSIKSFLTKKNIISVLILALIIIAVPLSVSLVQQQQKLRSKAANEYPIFFSGSGVTTCNGETSENCNTTTSTVNIVFRSPYGPYGVPGTITPPPATTAPPPPTTAPPPPTAPPTAIPSPVPLIRDYGVFTYATSNGSQKVVQSLQDVNGFSYARTCDVSGDSVDCSVGAHNWTKSAGPFTAPVAAPDGSRPMITDYEAFTYTTSGGQQKVVQSLLDVNSYSYARTCDVSGDSVDCSVGAHNWTKSAGPFTAPGNAGVLITDYGVFTYRTTNGSQKVVQTLQDANGYTYARTCDVSGDSVDCSVGAHNWTKSAGPFTAPAVY